MGIEEGHMRAAAIFILGVFMASASAEIVVKDVTYKSGDETLKGVLAYDDAMKDKRPGMLVVHEWWGITQHVRDYTRDLAAKGYTALAVDMYAGKTADNPKDATGLMNQLMGSPEVMKARFVAGEKFLSQQPTVDAKRMGAIGFCMGGKVVLDMARAGEPLAGVASFHGNLDAKERAKPGSVKARVLVMNGADDPFVKRESIDAFKKEMEAAKVNYRFTDYPGAVHAFTNPEATEKGKKFNLPLAYNADADKKSKAEMLKFFSEIFDKR
jgi:dienelactone hydrolase